MLWWFPTARDRSGHRIVSNARLVLLGDSADAADDWIAEHISAVEPRRPARARCDTDRHSRNYVAGMSPASNRRIVESGIEKIIVGLERCSLETAFGLELGFERRSGIDLSRCSGLCDSSLEEARFEPSVPRDTPKFSTPAHVTCLTPCTRKSRREREPILRGCRPPPAEPMVRILFPPAESPCLWGFRPCTARETSPLLHHFCF